MKNLQKLPLLLFVLLFATLGETPAQPKKETAVAEKPNPALQQLELGDEYFRRGDYEKAEEKYEPLLKDALLAQRVHKNYVQCLVSQKKNKQLERYLEKVVKRNPTVSSYSIDLANYWKNEKKEAQAEKVFNNLVKEIAKMPDAVQNTAVALSDAGQLDWAETLILESRKALGQPLAYVEVLASIYRAKGNISMLLDEMLGYAGNDKNNLYFVEQMLQQNLRNEEDLKALERILISRLQGQDKFGIYSNLLYWLYLQRKDFAGAFIQARAIDKRENADGVKIMECANVALQNKSYEAAANAFEYVYTQYPSSPSFYFAKKNALVAKEYALREVYPPDLVAYQQLVNNYIKLIDETTNKPQVAEAMQSVARIYSQYLNKSDSAEFWFNEVINNPRVERGLADRCKIELADLLLSKEIFWEATLLYSQVEKSQKETPIGHEAKLRNAKLSYYKGEFQLAIEHLDVLKIATSREISNDAMDLALMITDNTVFDTTGAALKAYSKAELLLIQNKQVQALAKLDSLEKVNVDKSLHDEILWLRAKIYRSRKQWTQTLDCYAKLSANYSEGLYGDDALYFSALIYEDELKDTDKAKLLYEEFLKKYPGSIYLTEVRKRFRKLRGDDAVYNEL